MITGIFYTLRQGRHSYFFQSLISMYLARSFRLVSTLCFSAGLRTVRHHVDRRPSKAERSLAAKCYDYITMSEFRPEERIEYTGPLKPVLARAAEVYGLGDFQGYTTIPVGYEDFNAHLQTSQGEYFVKIFASRREPREITRYEMIMQAVVASEVNCPVLHATNDGLIYRDRESNLGMVAMDFIRGRTFYELQRSPDDTELRQVLEQAVRIQNVPHHPEFLFDSWAITNLAADSYLPVREYMSIPEFATLERIVDELGAVASDTLPHALVHGDITKSNTLAGDDGKIYILDFSVANWYPCIQELAVIVGNLLNDPSGSETFLELLEKVVMGYVQAGGQLSKSEAYALPVYARAAYAAEFVGALREKYLNGNDSVETDYWMEIGRSGLTKAYE